MCINIFTFKVIEIYQISIDNLVKCDIILIDDMFYCFYYNYTIITSKKERRL